MPKLGLSPKPLGEKLKGLGLWPECRAEDLQVYGCKAISQQAPITQTRNEKRGSLPEWGFTFVPAIGTPTQAIISNFENNPIAGFQVEATERALNRIPADFAYCTLPETNMKSQ